MKVLSYNISWQSMTGLNNAWEFCNNNSDKSNERHYSKCIHSVVTMIDQNGPYDFVALQEASNHELIINNSSELKNLPFLSSNPYT